MVQRPRQYSLEMTVLSCTNLPTIIIVLTIARMEIAIENIATTATMRYLAGTRSD
jgi:hypothetical protein